MDPVAWSASSMLWACFFSLNKLFWSSCRAGEVQQTTDSSSKGDSRSRSRHHDSAKKSHSSGKSSELVGIPPDWLNHFVKHCVGRILPQLDHILGSSDLMALLIIGKAFDELGKLGCVSINKGYILGRVSWGIRTLTSWPHAIALYRIDTITATATLETFFYELVKVI